MCWPNVIWYACGCEGKTVKLETCNHHTALKALIEQDAQSGDSGVVENSENCFRVMDQGRTVVMKNYKCDRCQHIYTEETYGTEGHAQPEQEEAVANSENATIGESRS
jgi:hypothetical protein